jgi:amyloid beta precursor protein binding protein 1
MNFYVLLRAVDQLAANYSRWPGIFDGYMRNVLKGASLFQDLITEVCRFAGAEIHFVATFIDGVAS